VSKDSSYLIMHTLTSPQEMRQRQRQTERRGLVIIVCVPGILVQIRFYVVDRSSSRTRPLSFFFIMCQLATLTDLLHALFH
jgi:hypothetical protein